MQPLSSSATASSRRTTASSSHGTRHAALTYLCSLHLFCRLTKAKAVSLAFRVLQCVTLRHLPCMQQHRIELLSRWEHTSGGRTRVRGVHT